MLTGGINPLRSTWRRITRFSESPLAREFVVEPGRIDVYAGNSSSADMVQSFEVR